MCAKPVKETLDKVNGIVTILKRENKKYIVPIVTIVSMTKSPFMVLISCLLSLRTKDKVTAEASNRLFKLANNPEKILGLSIKNIEKAIYPVGFYKTKAKRIKEICKALLDDYGGVVPDEIDELLKLNGVGRKTAKSYSYSGLRQAGNMRGYTRTQDFKQAWFGKDEDPGADRICLKKKIAQKTLVNLQ